jgi:hypothetical protein
MSSGRALSPDRLNREASDLSVARDQGQDQRERSGGYHAIGKIRT